jgi:hypothetical protein
MGPAASKVGKGHDDHSRDQRDSNNKGELFGRANVRTHHPGRQRIGDLTGTRCLEMPGADVKADTCANGVYRAGCYERNAHSQY